MGILKDQIKAAYQAHFTIDDADKLDDFAEALEDAIKAGLVADMVVTTATQNGAQVGVITWNS